MNELICNKFQFTWFNLLFLLYLFSNWLNFLLLFWIYSNIPSTFLSWFSCDRVLFCFSDRIFLFPYYFVFILEMNFISINTICRIYRVFLTPQNSTVLWFMDYFLSKKKNFFLFQLEIDSHFQISLKSTSYWVLIYILKISQVNYKIVKIHIDNQIQSFQGDTVISDIILRVRMCFTIQNRWYKLQIK